METSDAHKVIFFSSSVGPVNTWCSSEDHTDEMHHLGDDLPDLHLELYIQPASRDMGAISEGVWSLHGFARVGVIW
jgi:hypothetical protein